MIYLILDKCGLQDTIIIQFIGFILGDNKLNIKMNYLENLNSLLKIVEPNLIKLEKDMPIFNISEKMLEILNIYLYLMLNKNENREKHEEEEEEEEKEGEEEENNESLENEEDEKEENYDNIEEKKK